MYGEVLNIVLETTQSKYGVFGYINDKGALVCPSMTKDIWDQCQLSDKDIIIDIDAQVNLLIRSKLK